MPGCSAAAPATVSTTRSWKRPTAGGVVSLDCGWSDVGAWSALWEVADRDGGRQCLQAAMSFLDNSRGNYLRSDSRLVAATGVENLVVVETADAVLVADRDKVQDVKRIVNG